MHASAKRLKIPRSRDFFSGTTTEHVYYTQVCRKRIEDACPQPTPALLRMRDRFEAPRDFRRKAADFDGFPVETADRKQVSNNFGALWHFM